MSEEKQPHTRADLLFRKTKALCKQHGVQFVTDAFIQTDDLLLLQIACGCRRMENQP